jgi:hypothetical protein
VGGGILVHSYGIHLEDVHAPNGLIAVYGGEPKGPGAVPSDERPESRDVAYARGCSAQGIVVGGDDVMIHDCEAGGSILGFGSSAGIYDSDAQLIEASASAWDAIVNGCVAGEISVAGVTNSDVTDCVCDGRISLDSGYTGTVTNSTACGGMTCRTDYVAVSSSTCYGDLRVYYGYWIQISHSTCIGGIVSVGLEGSGEAHLTRNTIVGPGSVGLQVVPQGPYFLNVSGNIVVGFDIGVQIENATGVMELTCNDVWDCDTLWVGVADPTGTDGNISADPLFCSAPGEIYTLHADSPCAEENNPGCGQIGAYPVGCGPSTDAELGGEVPGAIALLPVHPNPGASEIVIAFELPEPRVVRLEVFDVGGRLVKALVDGQWTGGRHTLAWNGRSAAGRPVAAGAYYIRMVAGDFIAEQRVTVLR